MLLFSGMQGKRGRKGQCIIEYRGIYDHTKNFITECLLYP